MTESHELSVKVDMSSWDACSSTTSIHQSPHSTDWMNQHLTLSHLSTQGNVSGQSYIFMSGLLMLTQRMNEWLYSVIKQQCHCSLFITVQLSTCGCDWSSCLFDVTLGFWQRTEFQVNMKSWWHHRAGGLQMMTFSSHRPATPDANAASHHGSESASCPNGGLMLRKKERRWKKAGGSKWKKKRSK